MKQYKNFILSPAEASDIKAEAEARRDRREAAAAAYAAIEADDRDGWDGAAGRLEQLEERSYTEMRASFLGIQNRM